MTDLASVEVALQGLDSRGVSLGALSDERPDEVIRDRKAVDFIAVSDEGCRTAIEHTLIEPYDGFIADMRLAHERLGPVREAVEASLPADSVFDISFPPAGANRIRREHQGPIATWIRDQAPRLGFRAPSHFAAMPDAPVEIKLYRWQKDQQPESPRLRYRIGVDLERLSEETLKRARRALDAKLPKLEQARVEGADSTLLVLETGDIQITNPWDLAATIRGVIVDHELPPPDHLVLALVFDVVGGGEPLCFVYRESGQWLDQPAMVKG